MSVPWWWLSFAAEHGWLGACVVRAPDGLSAVALSHVLGANPGGEVMMVKSPATFGDPPAEFVGRLLNRSEAAELSMQWTGAGLRTTGDDCSEVN